MLVPDFVSNLVYDWESSPGARSTSGWRLRSALILFDKRGTGLSDRGAALPNLETRMDDVRAVIDAAGSERAAIFGRHEGCRWRPVRGDLS